MHLGARNGQRVPVARLQQRGAGHAYQGPAVLVGVIGNGAVEDEAPRAGGSGHSPS
jgi:hypothetical protein